MTSMIKAGGDLFAFFDRPIAAALGIVTILVWLSPVAVRLRRRFHTAKADPDTTGI
jgi:TctA family transporter